jgi:hypothetical protein
MRFLRFRVQILNEQKVAWIDRRRNHFDQYFVVGDLWNGNRGQPQNTGKNQSGQLNSWATSMPRFQKTYNFPINRGDTAQDIPRKDLPQALEEDVLWPFAQANLINRQL